MGRKLLPWGLPVVYSIRAEQEASYSAVLPEAYLLADRMGLGGPLNGLHSVHGSWPRADLLLLGCDLQDMDEETIGDLIAAYRAGSAECYIYRDGTFAQPLCGIYTGKGLQRVLAQVPAERSLQGLIRRMHESSLQIKRAGAFANYNSL